MVAVRVRAAGAMLAGGLFLIATGCSGSTATAPRAAPPATAATSVTVMTTTPATTGVTAAGFPADFINTVPFRGGREQVLVPMTGTGDNAIIPGGPSYSADGRYLIYDTTPCGPSGHALLHIRDLSTGRELTGAGVLGDATSVFLDHDSEVVIDATMTGTGGTGLEVLRMPSMAVTAYPAPRGCRYQALAGTETELDALLQCGPGHELSAVAISPRTFTVTRTLIRLGSCLGGETISLAPAGPSAILAETYDACLSPTARATRGDYRIVKIAPARRGV